MWWGVVANDLIWVPPFAAILYLAHDRLLNQKRFIAPEVVRMALRARTQHEVTIDELTRLSPVLLVFLRHAGCTFCREALADLAAMREEIEKSGTRLVLVHMGTEEHARGFFAKYGLSEVPRVSDRGRALYRAFGLRRGGLADLFGPKVLVRGFEAGILRRHGVGKLVGDGFQMPGVFLIYHSEIIRSYRHQSAADRPDYMAIVTGKHYAQPELSS
jgi:peroxiredoxin